MQKRRKEQNDEHKEKGDAGECCCGRVTAQRIPPLTGADKSSFQYRALSADKWGGVGFRRGGLIGMDGGRSGWQTDQETEGRRKVSVVWRLAKPLGLTVRGFWCG